MNKLRIGVEKFASCSGCINEIVYALLSDPQIMEKIQIDYFPELQDKNNFEGKFDIFLVEGSVVNKEQIERLRSERAHV
jgi:coenzyme F420-reducing hydrogenase gamma subunit